jgi:hypothetical protein
MEREDVKKRLLDAYDYLYETGKIHSVTDLADKMKRSRPSVSRALNGIPEYLNEKFIKSFTDTFDMISMDWLITGNGDMFTSWTPDNNNNNTIDQSSLVNAALSAKDETIKAKEETIFALRETIESLKRENTLLRQQLNTYRIGEEIERNPFPIGVADNREISPSEYVNNRT